MKKHRIGRLMPIAGLALIMLGCEPEGEDSQTPASEYVHPAPVPNQGQGLDNFSIRIPRPTTKEMHQGESSQVTADVMTNSAYEVYIIGSNDGPRDKISVWADNNKIGEYFDERYTAWGRGWYHSQTSPTFKFNTGTNSTVNLGVKIEKADSYGASPNVFYGNRVAE